MTKFIDCSDAEKIIFLKDEFLKVMEEMLIDPTEIQKLLPEEQFKKTMTFLPSIKVPECNCGTCLSMDKLETKIPQELECLIDIARKRCHERNY